MSTTRAWYLAAAAAVVVVLLAGWFLLISPRNSAAGELRTQTEQAEATATTLRAQLSKLRAQAAGLAREQQRLQVFEQKMPATVALPDLIRAISGAATASQAELTSLTPGTPVLPTAAIPPATAVPSVATPGATASPSASGATPIAGAPTGGAAPYSVVPLTLTVTGTYFVLQRFFTAIETLPRALVLTSVALTPMATASTGSTAIPVLTAALSGSAYVSALPAVPTVSVPGLAPSATPTPIAN